MKQLNACIFWCLTSICCFEYTGVAAQGGDLESLWSAYVNSKDDTTRILTLAYLCNELARVEPDSAIQLAQDGLKKVKQIPFPKGEALLKSSLGVALANVGDYANAIKWLSSNLAYADTTTDENIKLGTYAELNIAYRDHGDLDEALKYSYKCIEFAERQGDSCWRCRGIFLFPAIIFLEKNEFDSAKKYLNRAFSYPVGPSRGINASVYDVAGRFHTKLKNYDSALQFYRKGIHAFLQLPYQLKGLPKIYYSMANLMSTIGLRDSTIFYLHQSLAISKQKNFRKEILAANLLLAKIYEGHDVDSALYYYRQSMLTKDILFDQEKQRQIASYKFDMELQEQQARNAQEQFESQIKIYILIGVALTLLTVGLMLWRNNHRRRKDLILIKEQKAETDRQKEKAEKTIVELKATQALLIQSEKMASLGELTAGVAHEIQNPLNFVNNFSEVNTELIDDLKKELSSGNQQTAEELAHIISENEKRISQHGKRAEGIVKSMLQHSRASSGQPEPTGINSLCDEYLRLAFHGYRAKDKTFNAKVESNFDSTIPALKVVPQDIGRVLLNLINNALYAVNEKDKKQNNDYEPSVVVSTKNPGDRIEIHVRDNGPGIPDNIKEKIFQPFFTTKPTGQGTGLGLSLSYDIVKAHGGELKVKSSENEGTEFIIHLPLP